MTSRMQYVSNLKHCYHSPHGEQPKLPGASRLQAEVAQASFCATVSELVHAPASHCPYCAVCYACIYPNRLFSMFIIEIYGYHRGMPLELLILLYMGSITTNLSSAWCSLKFEVATPNASSIPTEKKDSHFQVLQILNPTIPALCPRPAWRMSLSRLCPRSMRACFDSRK